MNLQQQYDNEVAAIDADYQALMDQEATDHDSKMALYAHLRDERKNKLIEHYGQAFAAPEAELSRPENTVDQPEPIIKS